MNKIVIAGLVASVGVAGYMLNQGDESPQVADTASELLFVPADTVVFSGQLTPFPIKKYLQSTSFQQAAIPDEIFSELEKDSDPQKLFLSSLLKTYFLAAQSADTFQATYGFADEMKSLVYAVGLMPVVRYQVADTQALWSMLDRAELESGFKHELRNLKGLEYRVYRFAKDSSEKPLELLIAQQNSWVTITLNTAFNSTADLEVALAVSEPKANLADTGVLEGIQERHGFDPSAVSFIDHQVLAKALTTKDGNRLAKMLTQAVLLSEKKQALANLRTSACEKELGAMVGNWPRTSFGLYKSDITAEHVSMHAGMVIESKSKVVMDALASIQGYLPSYLNESSVFGFGLGIDANTLNPALATLWSNMLEPEYTCEPLQTMQTSLRASNPAALAMFTGMVQGVKGIAVSLLDFSFTMEGEVPTVKDVQAIVSLSADNPDVLFNMTKAFAPPLARVELPADGSPVDLSHLVPPGTGLQLKPMLARKGEHIALYTGEKGAQVTGQLFSEKTKSNGILNFSMDYSRVLKPLVPILEMSAESEVQEQLELLKNLDMQVRIDMSIQPQGIELRTAMEMDSAKK